MSVVWSMVAAVVSSFGSVGSVPLAACLLPPVTAPVIDPFRDPGCEWCPGNRGLTYGLAAGTVVRAAAAGKVTFSGIVAGTRYVVVEHDDGLRATYGGLASSPLVAGGVIVTGGLVGTAGGDLHFGLRRGDEYVDPAPRLGRVVERARLVPTDGTAPRDAPPARLDCAAAGAAVDGERRRDTGEAPPGPGPIGIALPLRGVAPAAWRAPHHGYPAIDVMVASGTPVLAWRNGTVTHTHDHGRNCAAAVTGAGCRAPCGIGVTVADAASPGVTWTYCHLSSRSVGSGDVVLAGQPVGRSGDTGRSGAPHLHLELRVDGVRVCPQPALAAVAAGRRTPDVRSLPRRGCSS